MNYEDRDTYGMYKRSADRAAGPDLRHGPGPELMGADTLVGNDVYNEKGEDLGEIKEIMLDMHSGRVGYAVLSFGSFLGMGEKLFAVPWGALKLDTEHKRFVLNVEKDRLNRRRLRLGKWPNIPTSPAKGIHSYYGTKPH
jgi:sporulation protein YlmC with PRC-barrel domain